MGIIFPLILYFSLTKILWNSRLVQGWRSLEKIIFSMALSVSMYVTILSWSSLFPQINIRYLVFVLFIFGGYLTFKGMLSMSKFRWFSSFSLSKVEKYAAIIIVVLVVKVIVLYSIHPIIDPDIINTYLPYARTIVITGHAPPKDLYTADPVTIPPVGGSAIFAANYILSNTLYSDNFRLLTLPSFIGLLFLTYLYALKYLSRFLSLIAVIVLIALPGIDGLLLNWSLYPDVIYGFLGLTTFYLLEHRLLRQNSFSVRASLAATVGLILAASILLKSQGIVLVFISLIIVAIKLFKGRLLLLFPLGILIVVPYYLAKYPQTGITGFGYVTPGTTTLIFFSITSLIFGVLSLSQSKSLPNMWNHLISLSPLALASLGLAWFYRNIVLYGSGTTPLTYDYHQYYVIQRLVQSKLDQIAPTDLFSVLLAPTFGTIYLVPKVIGFIKLIKNKLLLTPIFWSIYLYFLTLTFFGGANNRYLLVIFPILSIMISLGIGSVLNQPKRILIGTIMFAALSLTQSDFIGWNFGPAFSRMSTVSSSRPSITDPPMAISPSETVNALPKLNSLIKQSLQAVNTMLRQLAGHSDKQNSYPLMILLGISAMIMVSIISRHLDLQLSYAKMFTITFIFILLPYLFIIMRVSQYRPWNFAEKERIMLFGNSGEIEYVSPYLKLHASPVSKILIFGPPTSTAYQTGLPAWNMYSGYGLKELFPILNFEDFDMLRYFSDNHIDYLVVAQDNNSQKKLDLLDKSTNIVKFIRNPNYFRKLNDSTPNNIWEIYVRQDLQY